MVSEWEKTYEEAEKSEIDQEVERCVSEIQVDDLPEH